MPDSRSGGSDRIDLVVVSHHHADHCGGMDAVIRTFTPRVSLATDSLSRWKTRLPRSDRDGPVSIGTGIAFESRVITNKRLERFRPPVDVKSRGPNAPDRPRRSRHLRVRALIASE
jgi:glyoxylase-like metal-dependent hydrolase (beta-lactamase superfamily II)